MARARYVGDIEELTVAPAGHDPFTVKRLEWVDVPADVLGKRPSGGDLGEGLLAQFDGDKPLWELESAKKAQRTRAAGEAADSGEEG